MEDSEARSVTHSISEGLWGSYAPSAEPTPPSPGPAFQLNPVPSVFGTIQREGHRGGSQEEPPWENKQWLCCSGRILVPRGSQGLALKEGMMSFSVAQKTDAALAALENMSIWETSYHVLFCSQALRISCRNSLWGSDPPSPSSCHELPRAFPDLAPPRTLHQCGCLSKTEPTYHRGSSVHQVSSRQR